MTKSLLSVAFKWSGISKVQTLSHLKTFYCLPIATRLSFKHSHHISSPISALSPFIVHFEFLPQVTLLASFSWNFMWHYNQLLLIFCVSFISQIRYCHLQNVLCDLSHLFGLVTSQDNSNSLSHDITYHIYSK